MFAPRTKKGKSGSYDERAGFDNVRIRSFLCGEQRLNLPPNPSPELLENFFQQFEERMEGFLKNEMTRLIRKRFSKVDGFCLEGEFPVVRVDLIGKEDWLDARPECSGR